MRGQLFRLCLLLLVLPMSSAASQEEVLVRYLHNSGWLVQTPGHALVFDYIGGNPDAATPSLGEGYLSPENLADRPVTVFVSHRHRDHFSEDLLGWGDQIPGIRFVFGWPIPSARDVDVVLEPRRRQRVGEIDVRTFASTDLGVGFVVTVDGLTVLHAGDHARWTAEMEEAFLAEIRYIAGETSPVDLAFFPIATGMACEPRESIREGVVSALQILRPRAALPMHVRCTDRLALYRNFADEVSARVAATQLDYPRRPGDAFVYRDGTLSRVSN